jgi:hypothetical protein
MTPRQESLRIKVTRPGDLLAVVPHLLGFVPADSLVVAGVGREGRRLGVVFRYDMPPMETMPRVAAHAASVLRDRDFPQAMLVGYGPGARVTPRMDIMRSGLAGAGIGLREALRVDEGRYWSYLCTDPACHPVEGTLLESEHPDPAALDKMGPVRASREDLAATVAPLEGERQQQMRDAYKRARDAADEVWRSQGLRAVHQRNLDAVQEAVGTYRDGGTLSDDQHAWLGRGLTDVRVRDDAWARMDPEHAGAHTRLWTDATRQAQPGYAAAPASLLAFTAAQQGQGALANIALDRAQADQPGYSMAALLGQALDAGVEPSKFVPPMTPEDVAAAYDRETRAGPDIEAGA